MPNAALTFERSQSTKRVTNVIVLFGVLASLALAFPMMIGFNPAIGSGLPLFFFVPFVASLAIATLIRKVRR
jgi:hypothetical protein